MIRVLTVAGALLVIAQLHRTSGGVVSLELHRVFGLGAGEIGLVTGVMMLASAAAQVPTGLAFDRYGIRRTVCTMVLVALAGTLLFASAAGLAGLALGRFLIGAGFAGVVTSILLLAMRWAPAEYFSTMAATTLALASFVGGFLATAPLAVALHALGWRWTFLAITALTVLAVVAAFGVIRDSPDGDPARGAGRESLGEGLAGLRALVADPDLRRIFAMAACTIAPFACVGGLWAGPYLQDLHGLTREATSYVLLGMVTMLNLGTLAYGPLDRWFGTRRGVVLCGGSLTGLVLAALALMPEAPLWLVIVLLHLLGLVAPFYVTLAAHARGFVPIERAGRLVTTISLSALTAASLAQWLSGLLLRIDRTGDAIGSPLGYRLVFGFLALMLLLALLAYQRAPERPSEIGASPTRGGLDEKGAGTGSCKHAGGS